MNMIRKFVRPVLMVLNGKPQGQKSSSHRKLSTLSNHFHTFDESNMNQHDNGQYITRKEAIMHQFFDEHGPLGVVSYGPICLVEIDPVISQAKDNN